MNLSRRTLLRASAALRVVAIPGGGRASTAAVPVVRIRDGRLAGMTRNGIQVFLGIPYGAPTGGERRFLPPAPPRAWRGIRSATAFGERCPQPGEPVYAGIGSGDYMSGGHRDALMAMKEPTGEDCLVLNVLTPHVGRGDRPVMVYLHGGGFSTGSGATMSVADRYVSENDQVVVTVNHRLGPLGFAYLGGIDPRYAQGNVGMLDLVQALRWVRDNIAAFGGDPAKVTIFGESGGGAKVATLLALPQAAGLFRRAIIMSGGGGRITPASTATATVTDFLTKKGLATAGVQALTTMSTAELLALGATSLVLDGRTIANELWKDGPPPTAAAIPLIIGTSAHEETGFAVTSDPTLLKLSWEQLPARVAKLYGKPESEMAGPIAAYRAAYPRGDATDIYFRMRTLSRFGRAELAIIKAKLRQPAPVYVYRSEYDPGLFGMRAFHTSDLPLPFRMVLQPQAEDLSRRMAGAWAAFARTGTPNGPGLPNWPRYDPTTRSILIFDRDVVQAQPDPAGAAQSSLLAIVGERGEFQ